MPGSGLEPFAATDASWSGIGRCASTVLRRANRVGSILLSAFLTLPAWGCESFDDLVADPNRPTNVNPSLLLTDIQAFAFSQVSLTAALASRYVVFTDGFNVNQYYGWNRGGFAPYDRLRSVMRMIGEAERTEAPNYIALGKFFRAFYFYELTQTFGDVPYSEALRSDGLVFTPAYDSQETVYAGILDELSEANDMLGPENGEILGDIIYGGDLLRWRKLVNSLQLRILMSLSAKPGNVASDRFRAIVQDPSRYPIFASNADNGQLVFHDRDGNRFPHFNNRDLQTAYFMEGSFVELLREREDPRLFAFAAPERRAVEEGAPGYEMSFASYGGLHAGDQVGENVRRVADLGEGSPVNPRYHGDPVNEPSIAIGYAEVEFLLAEAAERGWIDGNAAEHYARGVAASMEFYGISADRIAEYLTQPLVAYDPARGLELIGTQKHIALFMNSGWEAFFNQRRTGYPELRVGPATQNGGRIPKRWMYPQAELDTNPQNVAAAIQRQFGSDDVNGVIWSLQP